MTTAASQLQEKKARNDLFMIVGVTFAVLGVLALTKDGYTSFGKDPSQPILLRTLLAALMEFGVAGLGITVAAIFRKDSFFSHGLQAKGALPSIVLSVLCAVPSVIFLFVSGRADGYLPFQSVWVTKEVLASGFPINAIGMALIALSWGFFEGFNYVFIADVVNKMSPPKNMWVNWGAISCAIMCVLVHGAIGVTAAGIADMLTTMVWIYGMLIVRERTGNGWGPVFTFVFLWNAF